MNFYQSKDGEIIYCNYHIFFNPTHIKKKNARSRNIKLKILNLMSIYGILTIY